MARLRTIEDDPEAALTGLLAVTVLLAVSLAVTMLWVSVSEGSWLTGAGGVVLLGYLLWAVRKAGRIIRRGLRRAREPGGG